MKTTTPTVTETPNRRPLATVPSGLGRAAAGTLVPTVPDDRVDREADPTGDVAVVADGDRHATLKLIAGIAGRMWLSFLAGTLLVTLLPLLFGWKPHVVESGSMAPGIEVGDVVVVSPQDDPDLLLGRVAAFESPTRADPDRLTIHRIIGVDEDGSYTTKGDANPSPDSELVDPVEVLGMGRLLVQWAGLPLIWIADGAWLPLALLVASIVAAAAAVAADDDELADDLPDSGGPLGPDPDDPATSTAQPGDVEPSPGARLWGGALLVLAVGSAVLGIPTTAAAAFVATTANTANTWAAPNISYAAEIVARGPYLYWRLDESSGTVAADSSGNGRSGTYANNASAFARLSDGALVTDHPDRAVRANNANACIHTTSATSIAAPQVFTVVAWFRAAVGYTGGGKLVGFERPRTGIAAPGDGNYDRQLYLDGSGRLWFSVYNDTHVALSTPTGLADDQWHMAVGTMGPAGMRLFVDGQQVASNSNTAAENSAGWWRAACGNLAGWGGQWTGPNNPSTDSGTPQNRVFRGDLDEVTVYQGSALSPADVAVLYYAR